MSEIKSPLGNRSYSAPQKQVFSVPDESEGMFEIPGESEVAPPPVMPRNATVLTPAQFNELQAKKQALKVSMGRPTSEARQRIELLTGIGRLETEVEVDGHKFVLQSLKAREMREVVKSAGKVDLLSEQIFELRLQTLARSIIYIDGQPLDLILGHSSIEARLAFVDECEEHIVTQLYSAYSEMIKQNENKFALKSATDAHEVVDEIKK
jgi:hypothetical protein